MTRSMDAGFVRRAKIVFEAVVVMREGERFERRRPKCTFTHAYINVSLKVVTCFAEGSVTVGM